MLRVIWKYYTSLTACIKNVAHKKSILFTIHLFQYALPLVYFCYTHWLCKKNYSNPPLSWYIVQIVQSASAIGCVLNIVFNNFRIFESFDVEYYLKWTRWKQFRYDVRSCRTHWQIISVKKENVDDENFRQFTLYAAKTELNFFR